MHSHLIPGIDDGVKTNEESFAVIRQFQDLGYKKLITTPHIMTDYYGNTAESVSQAYANFIPAFREQHFSIDLQFAAEYYLDETLLKLIADKEKVLTFGDRYFLFETNAVSEPLQIKEFIFSLTSQGYRPIIAHPERYQYMTLAKAEDLANRGVLLQINMLSLIGYYGPPIQKLAEKLIEKKLVSLLGSDCHNLDHISLLKKVHKTKTYQKALELPLLNFTL
jgi:protein-tyrosine phosphatase